MNIEVINKSILDLDVDAIVVNLFSDAESPSGATAAVDKALDGAISSIMAQGRFSAGAGQTEAIRTNGALKASHVIIVGLGKSEKLDWSAVRKAAGKSVGAAMTIGCTSIATIVHGAGSGGLNATDAAQALAEGLIIGGYRYRELKTTDDDYGFQDPIITDVETVMVAEQDDAKTADIRSGIQSGTHIAEAVNLSRTLTSKPANLLGPGELAQVAHDISTDTNIQVSVIEGDELRREGLNLIAAVGGGSVRPPVMIVMRYMGRGGDDYDVAYVGKGLTFDSGGLQIKPGGSMRDMKVDMAGAGAVMAATWAIARLGIEANVLTVIPAVESMLSGTSMRPGDVIKSYSGKTVEVLETDAEGRLVLADGIAWAESNGADRIIDVATLTGACATALGSALTGLFCNDDELEELLIETGKEIDENMWAMPLVDEYRAKVISDIADLKNHGGTLGGLIVSAMFLKEFTGKARWAHLDIAGTSRCERASKWFNVKGATGVPVRTLIAFAEKLAGGGHS